VVVTVPSAETVLKVKVATPKALRHVASAQHVVNVVIAMWNNAAKVAAHAKTATAVAVVNHAMPKAKPLSTTTPHLKPKPKPAPKRATNAWPAKSVAKAAMAANNANLALSAANVVKVKTVANAAHVASATKVAVNAPHVWTKTATQKSCHSTTQQRLKAKHRNSTRTVASVVSAAHVTAMAVTAASVATVHRVKKVPQNTPTTAHLLSTTMQRMTTLHTSKRLKRPASHVSHANRVNHASNANLAVIVKNARHVTHLVKMRSTQHQRRKPLPALACHAFKRSHCLWPTCKLWPKAAVWNGSTPIQNASPPCKPLLQPSPSPCMCHASAHRW
jgi:hypothetical protein